MIEFVMSRVWMIIAALVLTAVVLSAFAGMDRDAVDQASQDRAESFARMVEEMGSGTVPGVVILEGSDVLLSPQSSLRLRNGSMWLEHGSAIHGMEFPDGVAYYDRGMLVECLMLSYGDAIRVRAVGLGDGRLGVQVEKVDATALTASTNLLHS